MFSRWLVVCLSLSSSSRLLDWSSASNLHLELPSFLSPCSSLLHLSFILLHPPSHTRLSLFFFLPGTLFPLFFIPPYFDSRFYPAPLLFPSPPITNPLPSTVLSSLVPCLLPRIQQGTLRETEKEKKGTAFLPFIHSLSPLPSLLPSESLFSLP